MAFLEKSFIKTQLKKHWSIRAQAFRPSVLLFSMIEILCIGLISVGIAERGYGQGSEKKIRFLIPKSFLRGNPESLAKVMFDPLFDYLKEQLKGFDLEYQFSENYVNIGTALRNGHAELALLYAHEFAYLYASSPWDNEIEPVSVVDRIRGIESGCLVVNKKKEGNQTITALKNVLDLNKKLKIAVPKDSPGFIRPVQRHLAGFFSREWRKGSEPLGFFPTFSTDAMDDVARNKPNIIAALVDCGELEAYRKNSPSMGGKLKELESYLFAPSAIVYNPRMLQMELGAMGANKFIVKLKNALEEPNQPGKQAMRRLMIKKCVNPPYNYDADLERIASEYP